MCICLYVMYISCTCTRVCLSKRAMNLSLESLSLNLSVYINQYCKHIYMMYTPGLGLAGPLALFQFGCGRGDACANFAWGGAWT